VRSPLWEEQEEKRTCFRGEENLLKRRIKPVQEKKTCSRGEENPLKRRKPVQDEKKTCSR